MGKNKTGKRADIISDIKDNFLNDTNYNLDNVKKDLGLVKNFRFSIKTSELYDHVNWIIVIYFLIAVVALVPIVYKLLPISKPAGMIVLSIWAIHTMSVAGILSYGEPVRGGKRRHLENILKLSGEKLLHYVDTVNYVYITEYKKSKLYFVTYYTFDKYAEPDRCIIEERGSTAISIIKFGNVQESGTRR